MKLAWKGSVHVVAGFIVGACGGATEASETMRDDGGTTSEAPAPSSGDGGAAKDGASDGGTAASNNGARCTADAQCTSGTCWKQLYCTIACPMKDSQDPICSALGGRFTGKCNRQGFCQMN